jgi:Fe-S-cluster-containing dehydrogenase component
MKRWTLLVDVARCTNCQNCVLATQDEHVGNEHPGYSAPMPDGGAPWITIERRTRGNDSMVDVAYVPKTCNHCDQAPCVRAAGDGSIYQRADGIVMIDPVKSRGRRDLVASCPYGAISWNEQAGVPQKWNFDAHLLDAGWREPRCVQACPTGALQAALLTPEELDRLRTERQLEPLAPMRQAAPRVLYRNLRRSTSWFIGGTVVRERQDGGAENVPDAAVELVLDGKGAASLQSDAFGDFKFDDLAARPVSWELRIRHARHGEAVRTGTMSGSLYVGTLVLS